MADRGKGFPRIGLASAVQIIDSASKFGRRWKKGQFAGFGAKNNAGSAKSGAFAARLSALRDYGLITSTKDEVALTDLAISIVKPVTAEEREKAIQRAFLSVGTFADLFASFDGGIPLPKDKVAEHAVFSLGVSRESKDKFVNTFIDSGVYVNLVSYSKEGSAVTLVKPENSPPPAVNENDPEDSKEEAVSFAPSRMPAAISPTGNVTFSNPSDALSTASSEQGVNHAGNGWSLTVVLKTNRRLSSDVRKKVRNLLEQADELSDDLHSLEEIVG